MFRGLARRSERASRDMNFSAERPESDSCAFFSNVAYPDCNCSCPLFYATNLVKASDPDAVTVLAKTVVDYSLSPVLRQR
ncbi:hypothetical protein EVAR_79643_1 [Eumeta japonica]|uniref:Uncharacterized protein n=1 Tax=Eumeta variegata TaxID=151549 RepID=A0A4C1WCE4_EUMVA|nr:hypothetical protein EVAR_79643_1 [Eumeta japonica]